MRIPLLFIALLMPAAGCAAIKADPLPICDGRARRPANPHGSVLLPPSPTSGDTQAETLPPADGASGGCA